MRLQKGRLKYARSVQHRPLSHGERDRVRGVTFENCLYALNSFSRAKGSQPRFFAGGRGAVSSTSTKRRSFRFTMKRFASNFRHATSPARRVRHLGAAGAHVR